VTSLLEPSPNTVQTFSASGLLSISSKPEQLQNKYLKCEMKFAEKLTVMNTSNKKQSDNLRQALQSTRLNEFDEES
jgi:hypothetical protein